MLKEVKKQIYELLKLKELMLTKSSRRKTIYARR